MEIVAVVAVVLTMLWLSGRSWETRSPYPAVRLSDPPGHRTGDSVRSARRETVRTISRFR